MQTWDCYEVEGVVHIQEKKISWTQKHLDLGQKIYFHIICSFIPVTNVLRLCDMSDKDGFGSIHSISLHTVSTRVLLWAHADVFASPSPSCSPQRGQKAEVLGFLSCRLQSRLLFTQFLSLLRKAGWSCAYEPMQSESKEQWYQQRMYHLSLSTSPQNTQTSALKCCMQQIGVKHQLCPKLLIHTKNSSGQEPFFCSLFAQCLPQWHLFHGRACSILKKHKQYIAVAAAI